MGRKSNDMASLLGSRGRLRGRSGVMPFVRSLFESWFARSSWRSERSSRPRAVPGWIALAAVAVAFGGGYLVGGRFGGTGGSEALHMKPQPNTPGFQGEVDTKPLAKDAYIVAAYVEESAPADGKARAAALSDYLQRQGITTARPYEFAAKKGNVWTVAVYYRNDTEMQGLKNKLLKLPEDVPDTNFVARRKQEKEWPVVAQIR